MMPYELRKVKRDAPPRYLRRRFHHWQRCCGRNYGFYKINIENQTDNENIQISMRERERARSLGGAPDFKPRSEQQMNTEPNDLVIVVELWTIDNVTTLILGWIHVHARCLARPGNTLSPLIETPIHTQHRCVAMSTPKDN